MDYAFDRGAWVNAFPLKGNRQAVPFERKPARGHSQRFRFTQRKMPVTITATQHQNQA
jgi:hypothetical protein